MLGKCSTVELGGRVGVPSKIAEDRPVLDELGQFRDAVREHRRRVGRSQQQLAAAIGLHPNVLSHKLNGHARALLSAPEAVRIVITLADWGAVQSQPEAETLLGLAGVAGQARASAWDSPALAALPGRSMSVSRDGSSARESTDDRVPLGLIRVPAARTPLIGREQERHDVAEALRTARLVTLTGVGGTGKTRLAMQVAQEVASDFPDGIAFVDLSSLRDPALLATVLAVACGLAPGSATEAEGLVIETLTGRQVLLLVDNVEQVVEGAATLGRVLAAVPGVRVLATSRVPLRLYGEYTLRVPPLGLSTHTATDPRESDAVTLFLARARAARHDFATTPDQLATAAVICATVDGLPLAIELAAANTRRYALPDLLTRLQSGIGVLQHGPRDAPSRHQALRATLDWGFTLLPQPAQRLLTYVSVFAGRFDVAAAAAVSGEFDEDHVGDTLAELSDHSMLEINPATPTHFTMLQTVREYAAARLAESGEQDLIERRNLHHLVERAELLSRLTGPPRADALATMEDLYPNVRVALEYAIQRGGEELDILKQGLQLAAAIAPLWMYRTPAAEGLLYLENLLAVHHDELDAPTRAAAELRVCSLACFAGDYELAARYSVRSAQHFDEVGDQGGIARALRYGGEAAHATGNPAGAAEMYGRALNIARAVADCEARGHAANMLGQLLGHERRLDEAREHLVDAIFSFHCAGFGTGVGAALHSLAEISREHGQLHEAELFFLVALQIADATGDIRSFAYIFEGLATVATLNGKHRDALRLLGLGRTIHESLGTYLVPLDQARLDEITAASIQATTLQEQRAAQALSHTQPALEAVRTLLHAGIPTLANSTDAELMTWIAEHLEPDHAAKLAAAHRDHQPNLR